MKITTAIAFIVAGSLLATDPTAPYPVEYQRWTVTRTFIAGPDSTVAGFHHYYANEKAMVGFTTGKFPDGSVIVDERREVEQHGSSSLAGKRVSVAVMMKDSQRFASTGGWSFDIAMGDSETLSASAERKSACYSCHLKQKDRDFVYSSLRK